MRRSDPYRITVNFKHVFNIGFQCYCVRFPEAQSEKVKKEWSAKQGDRTRVTEFQSEQGVN